MSSPKERRKTRRRVEKQVEQAFEAVAQGNLVLAEKLTRRAIEDGSMNPRIWNDHGQILLACGQAKEAEEAYRTAIALAPTYGDAFQNLARLQAARGKIVQAVRLQRRAVELLPGDRVATELLRALEATLPEPVSPEPTPLEPHGKGVSCAEQEGAGAATLERTDGYDWNRIATDLRRDGAARLPGLLSTQECRQLIDLGEDDDNFEHDVAEDREELGRVCYRFFATPLPPLVAALRAEVYARLAPVANDWQELLGRRGRFPATLPEFLAECHKAGQHRSTPILLRYEQGGFHAPHQDIAGRIVFPLQLAVTLGPEDGAGDPGGDFLLVDCRPGRKVRARRIATRTGDGVVFCARERLVEVAGALGLQPVRHGLDVVRAPLRYALGVPFHEHG